MKIDSEKKRKIIDSITTGRFIIKRHQQKDQAREKPLAFTALDINRGDCLFFSQNDLQSTDIHIRNQSGSPLFGEAKTEEPEDSCRSYEDYCSSRKVDTIAERKSKCGDENKDP